jgi:dephospho-CoA kinase
LPRDLTGPPVVCLIGGIGSGKSQVAAELARHGGRVIVGDRIGHEALRQPQIKAQIVGRWGNDILNEAGEVARSKLAAVVFSDAAQRQALEVLVFPWITARLEEQVAAARLDPAVRFVVVDAAVLLEAGWNSCCDCIVFVHAPRSVRLRRLARQRGWSEREVDARARAQQSLTDKVSRADFVIDNSGSLAQLGRQVDELMGRLLTRPG